MHLKKFSSYYKEIFFYNEVCNLLGNLFLKILYRNTLLYLIIDILRTKKI